MAVCVFVLDRKKGNIDKAKIFVWKFGAAACIGKLRGMCETRDGPSSS